jgi:hypothetical protein
MPSKMILFSLIFCIVTEVAEDVGSENITSSTARGQPLPMAASECQTHPD